MMMLLFSPADGTLSVGLLGLFLFGDVRLQTLPIVITTLRTGLTCINEVSIQPESPTHPGTWKEIPLSFLVSLIRFSAVDGLKMISEARSTCPKTPWRKVKPYFKSVSAGLTDIFLVAKTINWTIKLLTVAETDSKRKLSA